MNNSTCQGHQTVCGHAERTDMTTEGSTMSQLLSTGYKRQAELGEKNLNPKES